MAGRISLAVLAWRSDADTIASEKYTEQPIMKDWIEENIDTGYQQEIGYVDEVFADDRVRVAGNLADIPEAFIGIKQILGIQTLMFRTVEPKMTGLVDRSDWTMKNRSNEDNATTRLFKRFVQVPDRRDIVEINYGNRSKK